MAESRAQCEYSLIPYWNFQDGLSVIDGVVFKGSRVVIPLKLRSMMLDKIHTRHLGEVKCKNRARQVLFWPQMGRDIENIVRKCEACITFRNKQQSEPLQPLPVTTNPWSRVSTDLFEFKNKQYLVCVDSYSGYPEVEEIYKQTSTVVIKTLKKIFSRQGIPEIVYSDNGPCYSSEEFRKFADAWEFKHVTSSPLYPKSNGLSERMVQTVKNIFKKCDSTGEDRDLGLLIYRATPLECGKSPAELLGRNIKSNLPFKPTAEKNEPIIQRKLKQKIKQKFYHDQNAKPLEVLEMGNSVRIRDNEKAVWEEKGKVIQEVAPRSYLVKTERGRLLRRNRRDILKTNEFVDVDEDDEKEVKIETGRNQNNENMDNNQTAAETLTLNKTLNDETDQNKSKAKSPEKKKEEPRQVQPLRRSSRVSKKPNRLIEAD